MFYISSRQYIWTLNVKLFVKEHTFKDKSNQKCTTLYASCSSLSLPFRLILLWWHGRWTFIHCFLLYFVRPQKTITKTLRTKNLLQYSNWTAWTEMLIYQKSIAFLSFFIWPVNSFTSLALNGWSHAISVLKMRYRFG